MVPDDADEAPDARPPLLCRDLNAARGAYVVIGGMAVIQAGFPRATADIDLLIDISPTNQERVRRALMKPRIRPSVTWHPTISTAMPWGAGPMRLS